ncbi:MAG: glycerate kinase [Pseudomonadota bacterium]
MSADFKTDPSGFLLHLFEAAVASVAPEKCLPRYLPALPTGRTVVIGAGKAAAAMAACVDRQWQGPLSGLVVTRYGHGAACGRIEILEAAHPVPDIAGQKAALRTLEMVKGLNADDLVICLMSGGGSALLTLPAAGITLANKQEINTALLKSGATIFEMNCVRKHLSAIKGGRLALACAPARLMTLAISDIPGDDPAIIASGPTLPDASTCADALAILRRYAIPIPDFINDQLSRNTWETPKPGDARFARHSHHVIATAQHALEAVAAIARKAGLAVHILSDRIEGEAREVGVVHAAIARQVNVYGQPFTAPCVVLSGGETTVTVRGNGQGGRNTEFLLSLACALEGSNGIYALAADTDGIDGSADNCGALLKPDSLSRAAALGLSAATLLDNNDGYRFFSALGDLIVTGPTRTNVNDFRAMLLI